MNIADLKTANLESRIRTLEAGYGYTTPWMALPYINNWADYGAPLQIGGYCRAGGFVHFRGMVKRTVAGPNAVIFNLPAPYRPSKSVNFASVGNNKFCRIEVTATGDVYVSASDSATAESFVSLEGINFDTR